MGLVAPLPRRPFGRILRPGLARGVGGLALTFGWWAAQSPAGPPGVANPGPRTQPAARVASAPLDGAGGRPASDVTPAARVARAAHPEADSLARAKRTIADCSARYRLVQDYTCIFYKRERIDGKLSETNVLFMKARTRPLSIYFKCDRPNAGREAIWAPGHNGGKIVAHEAGITKVIAGTMYLDPKGSLAMDDNRHPISDAGIGALIETVRRRWEADLLPGLATVTFHPQARVGDRPCTLIEAVHASKDARCEFQKIRLYIDVELGLPIRIEAYDWPKGPGQEPALMEEYSYMKLKVNTGLKDRDFDPKNSQYSFGRF